MSKFNTLGLFQLSAKNEQICAAKHLIGHPGETMSAFRDILACFGHILKKKILP